MATQCMPDRHFVLAAVAGINALAAWAGAFGLMTGALTLTPELDHRLPWNSPVLGGLALAVVVAIPLNVLMWLAASGDRRTGPAAQIVGGLLVSWIVVQAAVLEAFSPFQPTYLVLGIVLIIWGHRIGPDGNELNCFVI